MTFDARAVCSDTDLWGLSASAVAIYLWPKIAAYVLGTISALANTTDIGPGSPGLLNVPVVFA